MDINKEEVIAALKTVLYALKKCKNISEASFVIKDEFDNSIKDEYNRKYTNGWHVLDLRIRYKTEMTGKNGG